MTTGITPAPLCKPSGEWRAQGKGPHDDIEVRVAYGLFHTPTVVAFLDGVDLDEMRISKLPHTWRLMLKGRRSGQPLVAFYYADTWRDLIVLMVTSTDSQHTGWQQDDHPPTAWR